MMKSYELLAGQPGMSYCKFRRFVSSPPPLSCRNCINQYRGLECMELTWTLRTILWH